MTVWVNTSSGVYHCPGTQYFGNTTRGEYLPEPAARDRGFRANGGDPCGSVPLPDSAAADTGNLPADAGPRRAAGRATLQCELDSVTDGDTITCEELGRVRLIGIDTPEGDQEPFGTAATAALASFLPAGSTLVLETDLERRDRYGRLLAYVWSDGKMINWLIVRQGWGLSYRFAPNLRYAAQLDAAQARARAERRGLWRVDGFRCPPKDHRRHAC